MRRTPFLAMVVLGACVGDAEAFNGKQTKLLCRLSDKCGEWDFGLDSEGDCEQSRSEQLDHCAQACDYDEKAARTCILRLRKALRPRLLGPDCNLDRRGLEACAAVYTNCEPDPDRDVDQDSSCDVPRPTSTCAVSPNPPPAAAWLLLLLPWLHRRRCRFGYPRE
ncbi:MAG: hypothetical protein IPH07_02940 [Deltaproteobacteria bacterium]|nr:hypothetical protein [Deltaproteobacteria bacterium]MBK8718625.1 hypothetical protein [Deltaproteobacteria bacterium]MBP7290457.1 hypothetical protein [Nannocystaceae bacterium]